MKCLSININTSASSDVCATNLERDDLNSDVDTGEALIIYSCYCCMRVTSSSERSTIAYGEIPSAALIYVGCLPRSFSVHLRVRIIFTSAG